MNKNIVLPITAIVMLLVMVAWMAGAFTDKISAGQSSASSIPYAVLDSAVTKVIERKEMRYEAVPASIAAKQATIISSRILAGIVKIHVRAGDKVTKGQMLIELEQKDLQARVSQAQQQIIATQARLTEAKLALGRAVELKEKGVLAVAALDKAKANYDSLNANFSSAQQSLLEAEAALSFAQIRSPIDGMVVDRFAEPGDTTQPGMQLLSLYNPLSLRIEAHVREQIALTLKIGQRLQVLIPSLPSSEQRLSSELEELVPAGNTGSRSFLVKSRLSYSENLLPGMYARLMVPVGEESVLLIPKNHVVQVGQLDVVWVSKNEKIEQRFIRTGKEFDDGVLEKNLIEVVSGLSVGEVLLLKP